AALFPLSPLHPSERHASGPVPLSQGPSMVEAMTTNQQTDTDRLPVSGEKVRGHNNDYDLGEVLGDGGYGTVFSCTILGRHLAVKVEKYSKSMLFVEASVLKAANQRRLKHFCTMVDGGSLNKEYVFIVMTLLGKDLHRLRAEQADRKFTMSTGLRIAIQTLEAIKELHEALFLSRDIKPGNFAPGHRHNSQHKTIFMFDFGLARRYVDKNNNLHAPRGEVGWRGTTRYGSLVAHSRQDLSRRDDVESWYYLLVEVTKGCLPWRLVTDRTAVQQAKMRARREERTSFLSGCPPCFDEILADIDSLGFYDTPRYDIYIHSLEKVCSEKGIRMTEHWDWEDESSIRHTSNATGECSARSEDRDKHVSHNVQGRGPLPPTN
ncbi:hypothetical protein PENTCL1PPCAC_18401, partial [Pristionchus entomophagus]